MLEVVSFAIVAGGSNGYCILPSHCEARVRLHGQRVPHSIVFTNVDLSRTSVNDLQTDQGIPLRKTLRSKAGQRILFRLCAKLVDEWNIWHVPSPSTKTSTERKRSVRVPLPRLHPRCYHHHRTIPLQRSWLYFHCRTLSFPIPSRFIQALSLTLIFRSVTSLLLYLYEIRRLANE